MVKFTNLGGGGLGLEFIFPCGPLVGTGGTCWQTKPTGQFLSVKHWSIGCLQNLNDGIWKIVCFMNPFQVRGYYCCTKNA